MFRSFLILLSVIVFFSCKKEPPSTIIKGIVIDSKTNTPIRNASVEIWSCITNKIGLCDYIYDATKSDRNGLFSYTLKLDAQYGNLNSVLTDNYVFKKIVGEEFKSYPGKVNEFTIPLIKLDGALKITIKNETGQHDFVHVVVYNPTSISEADSISGLVILYPVDLAAGEEKEYIIPLVANEYTTIAWGFDYFHSNHTASAHQDSVFLLLNDTLNYSIFY